MDNRSDHENGRSTLRTLLILMGLSALFILWGTFLFVAVGDKGPPDWSYGIVRDVPGESPYSTGSPKEFPGLAPLPAQGQGTVEKQHVRGLTEGAEVLK